MVSLERRLDGSQSRRRFLKDSVAGGCRVRRRRLQSQPCEDGSEEAGFQDDFDDGFDDD